MTTKELIQKAHKIASKYLEVVKIQFEIEMYFSEKLDGMELRCWYMHNGEKTHFFVMIDSDHDKNFSIEYLLFRFKQECDKVVYNLRPIPDKFKTTELEISEPTKTNNHEK